MNYKKLGNCTVYTSKIAQGKTLGCVIQLVHMSQWKNPPELISNCSLKLPHEFFDITKLLEYKNKLIFLDMAWIYFDYRNHLTLNTNKYLAHQIYGIKDKLPLEAQKNLPRNSEIYRRIFENGNKLLMNVTYIDQLEKSLRLWLTDQIKCVIYRVHGHRVMLRRYHVKYQPTPEEVKQNKHKPVIYPSIIGNKYFRYYDVMERI